MNPSPPAGPRRGVRADSEFARARPDDLVGALGRFCLLVHSGAIHASGTPASLEPFVEDWHAPAALERMARRVADGGVDPERFDPGYVGQEPDRLLDIAGGLWATHGAAWRGSVPVTGFGLADLEIADGEVCGWPSVEVRRFGDPYLDLSVLARDLGAAIGPAAVPALFDSYGLVRPQPARIEFWVLCSQLM